MDFQKNWTKEIKQVHMIWCHSSPCPMRAPVRASLAVPKPSSLQTTLADCRFQRSSHTVPQSRSLSTSTRPSPTLDPPFSLTLAWTHTDGQEQWYETLIWWKMPAVSEGFYRNFHFLFQAAVLQKQRPRHAADHSRHAPQAGRCAVGLGILQGTGSQVDLSSSTRHRVDEDMVLLTLQVQPGGVEEEQISVWIDGRINTWMKGWINWYRHEWINALMDGSMKEWTDHYRHEEING